MLASRSRRMWDWSALVGLALPAAVVALGLELLRLEFATAWAVYRERLDGSLQGLATIEVGILALAFLAPLVCWALGPGRALAATAGGVAVVRLAVQLVPDPFARLLLVLLGVVLLVWFVPVYLSAVGGTPTGRQFGPALLAGLTLDTTLHGAWGTWDHAWVVNAATVALTATLAAVVLVALARLAAVDGSAEASVPEVDPAAANDRRAGAALPLGGLGAALFLEVLLWQNLGRQAVMLGQPPPRVFLLVMVANSLALVAAAAAAAIPGRVRRRSSPFLSVSWLATGAAAAGLLLGVILERRAPLGALLAGQVAAAALVGRIGRCAAGRRQGPGLGLATAAWGAGILLFGVLVFAYYLVYERRLPYDNRWLPAVAAIVLAAAGAGAQRSLDRQERTGRLPRSTAAPTRRWPVAVPWLPAGLGLVLLAVPVAVPVAARPATPAAAPARGYPVRVLSYNVHAGYGDDTGWMDLEGLAREIEATGAEVIGLQEVTRGWYANGSADLLAWLGQRLRIPYAYVVFGGAADPQFGNALLSRRPVLASGVVALPQGRTPQRSNYVWADVELGKGRILHLVVTHLYPVGGEQGSAVRTAQVAHLLQGWGGRGATVLLGDLNATPNSPEMRLLAKAGLQDARRVADRSQADLLTHPSGGPEDGVDYLWLSSDLSASRFGTTRGIVSDHRGVAITVDG
jgi:endonuclease/exonuclease/phosphatase family metal-dependent hydrolase